MTQPPTDSQNLSPAPLLVMIPVYNDWDAALQLLDRLDHALSEAQLPAQVLLVDDGSHMMLENELPERQFKALRQVHVLSLRRNLGHQRAIAVGLAYVEKHLPCRALVVMDGDGEDAPEDVPRLYARLMEHGERCIVFAERSQRSEGVRFRLGYKTYKGLHRLLTGAWMRVGNFSIIPAHLLSRLVVVSELWNHYAAGVSKSRLPVKTLPTRRAQRLAGRSQMNLVSLVIHGLSAISVHGEIVGVRLLLVTSIMMALFAMALVATVAIRLMTNLAMPGWASLIAGLLVVLLLQGFMMAFVFISITLNSRSSAYFLPVRDFGFFIDHRRQLYPQPRSEIKQHGCDEISVPGG